MFSCLDPGSASRRLRQVNVVDVTSSMVRQNSSESGHLIITQSKSLHCRTNFLQDFLRNVECGTRGYRGVARTLRSKKYLKLLEALIKMGVARNWFCVVVGT